MDKVVKNTLKALKLNESTISTILGGLVVLVIGVLLYNYFRSTPATLPEITDEALVGVSGEVELVESGEGEVTPRNLPTSHTVAAGEHLWSISEKYFGNGYNWVDIAEANNLVNPGLIEVGMHLNIPQASLRYTKEIAMASPFGMKVSTTDSLAGINSYTVIKGDHLWSIALRAYGDGYRWGDIYQANKDKIADPNLIESGMELVLPR